jgi:hypothetical protein
VSAASLPTTEPAPARPKVFLYANGAAGVGVKGAALAEDGTILGTYACSSLRWLQRDLQTTAFQEKYSAHYPDGFELVWLGETPERDEAWRAAIERHQRIAKEPQS